MLLSIGNTSSSFPKLSKTDAHRKEPTIKHSTPHHGRRNFLAAFMPLLTSLANDIGGWPILSDHLETRGCPTLSRWLRKGGRRDRCHRLWGIHGSILLSCRAVSSVSIAPNDLYLSPALLPPTSARLRSCKHFPTLKRDQSLIDIEPKFQLHSGLSDNRTSIVASDECNDGVFLFREMRGRNVGVLNTMLVEKFLYICAA